MHYLDNEFRLWVEYTYYYSKEERELTGNYSYDLNKIFKVGKNSLTGLQQVSSSELPYPNPTRTSINIPIENNGGNLNIYDFNGRRIQSIPTQGESINLNVTGYPSGQYIYEQNGKTNRFIVQ